MDDSGESKRPQPRLVPFIVLLGISVFMYVSIMYKIIHYGP
jgi:hypothetical protein